jgi:hypothetical protein
MINWTRELETITENFSLSFNKLSEEEFNWKLNQNKWSIAQIIDHLIVVNETYFPVLESIKSGTYKSPFMAKFSFLVSFFGKTVLNSVKPNRRKKIKTFPIWEPSLSRIKSDVLNRFVSHQMELISKIEASKKFADEGVVISSPANKIVVYKLETAFDIIVAHEKRHFEQAKEIYELLKGKTAAI